MPEIVTVTVGPDAEHDYGSMNDLAEQAGYDLTAADEILEVLLYPMLDTTPVMFHDGQGWVFDDDRYVWLRTVGPSGAISILERKWSEDLYRLDVDSDDGDSGRALRDSMGLRIDALQVGMRRVSSQDVFRQTIRADPQYRDSEWGQIIARLETTDDWTGDRTSVVGVSGTQPVRIGNLMGYLVGEHARSGLIVGEQDDSYAGDPVDVVHCAFDTADSTNALYQDGGILIGPEADGIATVRCHNVWIHGTMEGADAFDSGVSSGSSHLVSDDDSAGSFADSKTNVITNVFSRVEEDFMLEDNDTVARNSGRDMTDPAEPLTVTHDLLGHERPQGEGFDIGPFEHPEFPPKSISIIVRDDQVPAGGQGGLQYAVFKSPQVDQWLAPVAQGSDAEIQEDGTVEVDLSEVSEVDVGETVYVYVTDSDGTLSAASHLGGATEVVGW